MFRAPRTMKDVVDVPSLVLVLWQVVRVTPGTVDHELLVKDGCMGKEDRMDGVLGKRDCKTCQCTILDQRLLRAKFATGTGTP